MAPRPSNKTEYARMLGKLAYFHSYKYIILLYKKPRV